ncbi:MAG: hypothetical protein Q609_ECAC01022G0002 [Escherichia coli DORA_A_5_14_21]|uniref:Uncharacterized protein n=1 Tax=Escherichia coli DORA_A_5_14_21 TaxID=1403943 RepID=W1X638_ECOLX|nr:MAG: hypothetical protein Q609_ECAC01022G0002 [Escherichia coli DORA_A_5_14_21]
MTTVNKKLKKTASGAITWSVIVTQILSPVSLSLIPANSFASSDNKDVRKLMPVMSVQIKLPHLQQVQVRVWRIIMQVVLL